MATGAARPVYLQGREHRSEFCGVFHNNPQGMK